MIITESQLREIIKESITKYTEQQIIEKINDFIKKKIGNHVDEFDEDLYYDLNIKSYKACPDASLRSHRIRCLKVDGADIYVDLLYGRKTEEWGYSYELIDGIAAESGSPKFKEFQHKYFFPNGRKKSKAKSDNQQTDIVGNQNSFHTASTNGEYTY